MAAGAQGSARAAFSSVPVLLALSLRSVRACFGVGGFYAIPFTWWFLKCPKTMRAARFVQYRRLRVPDGWEEA